MGTGQLGGVLLGVGPVRLFRRGQALAQLGQLDRLRLSMGLRLGELVGQRLDLGLGFVQRGLKVIHGRGSVSQLTLGLFDTASPFSLSLGGSAPGTAVHEAAPAPELPPAPVPVTWRLAGDRALAPGWRGRAADNLAAIRLLQRIEQEDRPATAAEQAIQGCRGAGFARPPAASPQPGAPGGRRAAPQGDYTLRASSAALPV